MSFPKAPLLCSLHASFTTDVCTSHLWMLPCAAACSNDNPCLSRPPKHTQPPHAHILIDPSPLEAAICSGVRLSKSLPAGSAPARSRRRSMSHLRAWMTVDSRAASSTDGRLRLAPALTSTYWQTAAVDAVGVSLPHLPSDKGTNDALSFATVSHTACQCCFNHRCP